VGLNFCDGIVEMLWRSNLDSHCTLPSVTAPGYTRIGSSVQISAQLISRMKNLSIAHQKGIDITKKIWGVNEIVELKLKEAENCGSGKIKIKKIKR